jgi:hypothetical protein
MPVSGPASRQITKATLTLFAAIFFANCAYAQRQNLSERAILPPLEYDHPYSGKLTIIRLATGDEMRFACLLGTRAFKFGLPPMGCSQRLWRSARSCDVHIVADNVLATVGLTYELMLRHEIGHCNGWPGDHPGMRFLVEPRLNSLRPERYPEKVQPLFTQ